MCMHNGFDVGARLVDPCVQVKLKGWFAFAFNQIAIEIYSADIVSGHATALRIANINEHASVAADGCMAIIINDALMFEHS